MPEEINPKEKERLKRAIQSLPELSGISVGELQTVSSQFKQPEPQLVFHAKIGVDILRDIRGNLIDIKGIISGTFKPLVKKAEKGEDEKETTPKEIATTVIIFNALQNLIKGGLGGAFRGLTGLIGKTITALGPFGIALGIAGASLLGIGLALKSARDKALAFGESLKEISPHMAALQAQREIATRLRGIRIGAAIAPEQQELIQSMIKLQESTEAIHIVTQKMFAEFGVTFNNIAANLADFGTKSLTLLMQMISFLPISEKSRKEIIDILKGIKSNTDKELRDLGIPRQVAEALASGKWWEREINLGAKEPAASGEQTPFAKRLLNMIPQGPVPGMMPRIPGL